VRIVFIGSVDFSRTILETLIVSGAEIVGVCTRENSKLNADHCDLSKISKENGIPWFYTSKINSRATITWIENLKPDVIFCIGWSQIISKELIELPPLGIIGFHPAQLPKNRGRHPITWALALGLEETASTFFRIDEGVDSGEIVSQERIPISKLDNAATLYEKLAYVASQQVENLVRALEMKSLVSRVQDHSLANVWRKRHIEDGRIDWRMSADSIHNLVRGLTKPYVGAHFLSKGEEVKVWRTMLGIESEPNIEPGKVLALTQEGPLIKCGQGSIVLLDTEPVNWKPPGEYL
jgi:methionyl-tRNA formyltransferase